MILTTYANKSPMNSNKSPLPQEGLGEFHHDKRSNILGFGEDLIPQPP